MATSELKEPVLAELKRVLVPLGYRKSGALFSLNRGEIVHLVELQSSQKSTPTQAILTVNLGIFVSSLIYADVRDQTKPSIAQAHWRQRLGVVMPENQDKWWPIRNTTEATVIAGEIASSVSSFGLKALAAIPNLEALRCIWESGICPGLTDFQRQRHLEQLTESTPR